MKPVLLRDLDLGLFEPFTDPVSGVRSFILRETVAPVQQGFYFTNSSFSADHRYLWFYCAFPPAPSHCLAVADLVRGTVHCDPATAFHAASPMVDDATGGVFWTCGTGVWRRGPAPGDGVAPVNRLPDELVAGRHIARLATHLTRSADGRSVLLDARIGRESVIGLLPLAGGDFALWGRYERHYNHGQMSPTDPDLALLAEDHVTDPVTGSTTRYTDRLWLQRKGQPIRPVFPTPTICTHEWWDAGGEFVYAVSYGRDDTRGLPSGTLKIDPQTAALTLAWPAWNWHAHDWDRGRWFVGDRRGTEFYRGCPSSVWFMNSDTGKEIAIVSHNPEHFTAGQQYHIDPHPRFSPDGSWIVFTTTVRGRVDVAIARTADLVERTI
jgi:hypothetical protein